MPKYYSDKKPNNMPDIKYTFNTNI